MREIHQVVEQARKQLLAYSSNAQEETVFFITTCDGLNRAMVWQIQDNNFDMAWVKVKRYIDKFQQLPKWMKIELMINRQGKAFKEAIQEIKQVKRNNYFPFGIEFGNKYSVLPEEIVGNALLVPHSEHIIGKNSARLQINEKNLLSYLKKKYRLTSINFDSMLKNNWAFFSKAGVFLEKGHVYPLETDFFGQGIRKISSTNQASFLDDAINRGTDYLMNQISADGSFIYGYYPAYGKKIPGYNSVRHFSSLYALIEAYEYSKDPALLERIDQGLVWGIENLSLEKEGYLFVTEQTSSGIELKLGAQAMVILALSKYEAVTKDSHYHQLMLNYLEGIEAFIDEGGRTAHVLTSELQVKERFRIIYYDGEALFAIMRAYPLTNDGRWLRLGERLMNRFIANNYEKFHDHWLSYSVNELTTYLPEQKYFEFGIKNAIENLEFISNRDTAYPTMLELLAAAIKMYSRLSNTAFGKMLIVEEDYQKLVVVMEKRALHEMRTGTMWPELAMYFAQPEVISGGFYARHARCRMRIDDAEHFLSGLINYQAIIEKSDC